ncbi:MAG: hypothetical protein C4278_00125 [Patescibacteria group bacterium]
MIRKIKDFLLKNLKTEQTIVKNSFWLALSRILGSIFRAVLVILSFRILGPEFQGIFYLAMNFVLIFSVIPDFGMVPIFIRSLIEKKEEKRKIITDFIFSFIFFFFISLIIALIVKDFVLKNELSKKIFYVLIIFVFFDILREILYALFRAKERMEYQALSHSFTNFVILISGLYFLLNFPNPYFLSYAYLIGGFLGFLLTFFLLRKDLIFNYLKYLELKAPLKIIEKSWAIGIANFIFLLITYIDTLILGYFKNVKEVGIYNSVVKINEVLFAIPFALASAAFPAITKKLKNQEGVEDVLEFGLKFALFISLPIFWGVFFLSKDFINFLYGKEYLDGDLALKLISFSIPFNFLTLILIDTLIALDKRKELLKFDFLTLLINVILNIIFIPYFGFFAASLITSISSFIFFIFSFLLVKKFIKINLTHLKIPKYLIISFLINLIFIFIPINFILKIILIALVYFGFMYLIKEEIMIRFLKVG